MLGIAVKNAILFLLIILIIHFLLRNILIEKKGDTLQEVKEIPHTKETVLLKTKNIEDQKNELLKFVMDDIETFQEQPIIDSTYKNEISTLTDTKKGITPTTDNVPQKKGKRNPGQNDNFLVIHEYEDESSLNGGKVLDGLDGFGGFDKYGLMFEEYK